MESNEMKNLPAFQEREDFFFLRSDAWEPLNGRKEYSINAKKQPKLFS